MVAFLELLLFTAFVGAVVILVRKTSIAASEDLRRAAQSTPAQRLERTIEVNGFDLIEHLQRQHAFSQNTFGPGERTAAVCEHIRKELEEIEAAPHDVVEWADLLMLAFDGAIRAGCTPAQVCAAMSQKLSINERRTWPDWRTADLSKPIEHTRPE